MSIEVLGSPVRVGDIILTRWPDRICRLTCSVTGDAGAPGKAGHQEMVDHVCPLDGPRVLAASLTMGKMVRWDWDGRKAYFAETQTEWIRWTRLMPFERPQVEQIEAESEKQFNTFRYSKGELLLQGIDGWRARIKGLHPQDKPAVWARRLGDWWGGGVICSKAGNLPFIRIGIFPEHARFWSPSDTLRYIDTGASGWGVAEKTPGW